MTLLILVISACSPTYKRDQISDQIKKLAKDEYKLDVDVSDVGKTIGIRFHVKNLLGELVASDQLIWKQVDDLMLVLSRIALSCDRPPDFLVLDILDDKNPTARVVFTRHVMDVKKIMAEALSRTQYFDRLLIEFVIGDKHTLFDPNDMDIVRFMMMASDLIDDKKTDVPRFKISDVSLPDFLADVAAKTARHDLEDANPVKDHYSLRQVQGFFTQDNAATGQFKILLDLVAKADSPFSPAVIQQKILPVAANAVVDLFRSYHFDRFSTITVIEKNSGMLLTVTK